MRHGRETFCFTDPSGLAPCDPATSRLEGSVETGYIFTCGQGGGGGSNAGAYVFTPGKPGRGPSGYSPTPGGGGRRGSGGTQAVLPSAAAVPGVAQCLGGLLLTTGGTASSLKEFQHIRGSGTNLQWRGANNKWYSATWGGNQWTGGRNAVVAAGQQARMAGRAFGGAGIVLSGGLAVGSFTQGDWAGGAFHSLDAVMAGVGTFGGPAGLGVSLLYFGAAFYAGC